MKHHEFHVAGKGFVVAVHYLDHVVSKDGKTSLLDFSTITSGSDGVIVLFLGAKLVFQEELVVRGVYHAVKDKLEHGITASENPAINALMHIFGTSQIDAIKQEVVPRSFHEPRAENDGLAMILVSGSDKVSALVGVVSAFRDRFSHDVLRAPDTPVALDAAVVRAWTWHKEPLLAIPGQEHDEREWLARTASARMALFSLNLQQKS
jgi:hypothetical protein